MESATEATEIQTELQANLDMPTARREYFDARLVERLRQCDDGFDFLVEASEHAGRLTKELQPIARVDFEKLIKATRDV